MTIYATLSLLLGVSFILSGCASMSERKRHQYVYINSVPAGATISKKDRYLWTTPAVIRLKRDRELELELSTERDKKTIVLETKYSWTESFASNLIFFSLAPIGWVTDLVTGAGWTIKDPETVQLSARAIPVKKKLRLAIAPPVAESFALSDEAAQYWEKQLPAMYPEAQVIPFHSSLTAFQNSGFDYDERSGDEQRFRQVYAEVSADRILLSEVKRDKNVVTLEGELRNVDGQIVALKPMTAPLMSASSWKTSAVNALPSWFQFIPNTAGLELANTQIVLNETQVNHTSFETGKKSNFGKAASYLQAFTLSRLQRPRFGRDGRWKFQFTPAARFSYKTVFFPDFAKLASVNFDILHVGAGMGPEFGYEAGRHYTYMKFIPMATFFQIDWQQPGGSHESKSQTSIDFQAEFGYLYFFSDRVSVRLFTKSTNVSVDLWNEVAARINPTTPKLNSSSDGYAGVAFGYTFDLHDRIIQH